MVVDYPGSKCPASPVVGMVTGPRRRLMSAGTESDVTHRRQHVRQSRATSRQHLEQKDVMTVSVRIATSNYCTTDNDIGTRGYYTST